MDNTESMFSNLKQPIDYTKSNLMYGVTDWGNLNQFNLYESGYSFLYVVETPAFLTQLANQKAEYKSLLENYIHILEFEFKGLDGIEDITSDPLEISDGINTMNVIGKVTQQSSSNVTMRYTEKSGSVITKLHELYLTGIKDPRTQIKRYHGLIDQNVLDAGYENEVFTLLYMVTDNTALNLEKAYLLLNAQPTKAETSIYESEKGNIENKELSVEFTCFPVTSSKINQAALQILKWMNTRGSGTYELHWNSTNFDYSHTEDIVGSIDTMQQKGGLKK